MGSASPQLMVAVLEHIAYVRIRGRASFTSGPTFRSLVYDLRDQGTKKYVLDLTECQIMDSTFLGILAGFSSRVVKQGLAEIELLNANERVLDLLENLGVEHLFQVKQGVEPIASGRVVEGVDAADTDKTEISRTVLEAHQTLMEINPDNIPKFKDIARFVAEDLKRGKE